MTSNNVISFPGNGRPIEHPDDGGAVVIILPVVRVDRASRRSLRATGPAGRTTGSEPAA